MPIFHPYDFQLIRDVYDAGFQDSEKREFHPFTAPAVKKMVNRFEEVTTDLVNVMNLFEEILDADWDLSDEEIHQYKEELRRINRGLSYMTVEEDEDD